MNGLGLLIGLISIYCIYQLLVGPHGYWKWGGE